MWGKITEEIAPDAGEIDSSWLINFWSTFTECIIELDANNVIRYVKKKADSSFVLKDIAGKPFLDIATEGDRELVADKLDQLKAGDVPYLRFQFLSVLDRYYRWTLAPYYKNDMYAGCHGVAVDVTEQTKKEITLHWQNAIIEDGRDFIKIFDEKGNLLYMNPGAYKMAGYDPSSEAPSSEQLYTKEHYERVYGEGLDALRKNGFWSGRGDLVRSDGTLVPIEHTMFSIVDNNNDIVLIASIIRDITVFLEHEKKLEEARVAAEAANVAKSVFLSNMSHEIRTPMNAIIGMVNIGLNADNIDRKNYCFERADGAAKHLLGIINDILDMSKIEADKLELSYGVFSVEKMLANITNMVNVRAEEKDLNLIVDLGHDVPTYIKCDEVRLSQVITNLLSNAIKFTPEKGTVVLSINKLDDSDNEVLLVIEVADTGIGISEEQQARLFSYFNQADASISQKYGGTGLGLAISKRIVELMGGVIWVESDSGSGSKFSFTLKTELLKDHDDSKGEKARHSKTMPKHDYSGHTLLIAEDIEINREIMSALLEESGVAIEFAEDGKAAVSMFCADPGKYDMILMDINMPEMDGYEATRKIRAFHSTKAKTIPIIAMTANVFKEDIENCILAGMNGHTGKPIDLDELFKELNHYLIPGA